MKIMYYELIKMLIDYERRNHPETYDATKTVGKIEGYQELTNKLQRSGETFNTSSPSTNKISFSQVSQSKIHSGH